MKKSNLNLAATVMICGAFLFSSCIGSFGLHSKLVNWNQSIGTKFVNELVYLACNIIPVYPVCYLADALVINSIEFWSGSNPMAKGTKVVQGNDGRYLVKCDGKGYTIESENDGSIVRLDFEESDKSWNVSVDGKEPMKFMTIVDDTHVALPCPDGSSTVVEVSEAGVMAYQAMAGQTNMAMR